MPHLSIKIRNHVSRLLTSVLPCNRYKSAIRGVDAAHHAALPEERKRVDLPALLVVSDRDYITRADMQTERTAKWVARLRVEELSCGHWVALEMPDELNKLLEGFANEVVGGVDG